LALIFGPYRAASFIFPASQPTMGANTGETLQERSKGKDVRTSNIVAAKVRFRFDPSVRHASVRGGGTATYRAVYLLFASSLAGVSNKFWPKSILRRGGGG